MLVTEFGTVMEVKPLQFQNAQSPIPTTAYVTPSLDTEFGIFIALEYVSPSYFVLYVTSTVLEDVPLMML